MRARATPDFTSPHVPLALLGAVLVWTTSIAGSGFSLLALPFALWSTMPYGGLWIVGRMAPRPWPILGAGAAAIAADLGIRASVFLWPRGSTAAIALVFSPAYITTFVMPIGAAAGWLFGTMWRWHLVGRIVTVIVGPLVLGLLMLGLARPELFPTTVIARRAVLERIGPPRIVAGAATIESVRVSTKAAWYQASDLDGQPGDELAIIEHSGADVLDSTTLDVRSHVPFGGEPGRLWGSFSTLVRFPDQRLGVAQTGGGYSRTRVQDLNGAELWEYHPDPKLSPDALRPADLEGDGRVEFYGSSTTFLARLDEGGREVWRRPTALAALLATLPRTSESPAWIVAVEYGRKVLVWDADGRLLMDRPATAADSPAVSRGYLLRASPDSRGPLGACVRSFRQATLRCAARRLHPVVRHERPAHRHWSGEPRAGWLDRSRHQPLQTSDRRFGSANRLRRDLRSLSACDRREARRWLGRGLCPRRDWAAAPASQVTRYSSTGSR